MIQDFVDMFMASKEALAAQYAKELPPSYLDIVKDVVKIICLDPERVHVIDDGNYQGTQLFIFTGDDYQPGEGDYYFVSVCYGSCSGCDTLESIKNYGDPEPEAVNECVTLALHIVQGIKKLT